MRLQAGSGTGRHFYLMFRELLGVLLRMHTLGGKAP